MEEGKEEKDDISTRRSYFNLRSPLGSSNFARQEITRRWLTWLLGLLQKKQKRLRFMLQGECKITRHISYMCSQLHLDLHYSH
jgi:hypothetical protein